MTGVYDSGRGGEIALTYLRDICPREDLVFLGDRKNAPYGTKSEDELIPIIEYNLGRLYALGCERVLIACCTASTVYPRLSRSLRARAIPIIKPNADVARSVSQASRIAVLATQRTVESRAFANELQGLDILELEASRLVREVEEGANSENCTESLSDYLLSKIERVGAFGADTLILGCTHFAALEEKIKELYRGIAKKEIITVNSARVGADIAARRIERGSGSARTVYID